MGGVTVWFPTMQLHIAEPGGSTRTVDLAKPLSLGRAADNDLAYPDDPALSRYHLCIDSEGSQWLLRDCGSRNGTILNGNPLTGRHRLVSGDRIYAGQLTIAVAERPSTHSVRFVADEPGKAHRAPTILTTLDQALERTHRNVERRKDVVTANRFVPALIRAGQELASHRPLGELFDVILDLALSAVDARRGVILTEENGQLEVRANRGEDFSISTGVKRQVLAGTSLIISDAQLDSALREQKSILLQQVRSILAVPLQTGDRVIGLIYVDNGTTLRPFSHEDLDLLTVMANVAAIRIEHARLAAVEQQEKLTQLELEQASEIQRNLLPADPPVAEGYEIGGYNMPCRSVGGDYFDFLPYSDGRIGLLVADVCGKGLPAAIMMSSLQARVQMLVESKPDAASALTLLNRNLAPRFPLGRFITVFYAVLDPATGALEYANAGHNYPLILRSGGEVEQLRGGGMVMGLLTDIEYRSFQAQLERGDRLVLYSDGVTEAGSPSGGQFGERGLSDFLLSHAMQPSTQLIPRLAEHVRSWCGSSGFTDDFTLVLVRRE